MNAHCFVFSCSTRRYAITVKCINRTVVGRHARWLTGNQCRRDDRNAETLGGDAHQSGQTSGLLSSSMRIAACLSALLPSRYITSFTRK